jgi:hypothetical protein
MDAAARVFTLRRRQRGWGMVISMERWTSVIATRAVAVAADLVLACARCAAKHGTGVSGGIARRSLSRRSIIVVVVLVTAGCAAAPARSHPSASSTAPSSARLVIAARTDWPLFSDNGVTFRYPPRWRSYAHRWASSFRDSLTYLSTVAVPDPCTTTKIGGGTETDCGQLLSHLGPHDVLIVWTEGSWPAPASFDALTAEPGALTRFGGHAAKVAQGPARAECGRTGAAWSITAVIARTSRPTNSTITMTACLGPEDESKNAADVMTMLYTIHITT